MSYLSSITTPQSIKRYRERKVTKGILCEVEQVILLDSICFGGAVLSSWRCHRDLGHLDGLEF